MFKSPIENSPRPTIMRPPTIKIHFIYVFKKTLKTLMPVPNIKKAVEIPNINKRVFLMSTERLRIVSSLTLFDKTAK